MHVVESDAGWTVLPEQGKGACAGAHAGAYAGAHAGAYAGAHAGANPRMGPPRGISFRQPMSRLAAWFEVLERRTSMQTPNVLAQMEQRLFEELHHTIYSLDFMNELPDDLRGKVATILVNVGELRQAHKGETWICEHEHTTDNGYILLNGKARVRRPEAPEGVCPAPELIGETMQFSPLHQHSATVSAMGDCMVLQFTWEYFWRRVQETFSEEEQGRIRTALENLAWDHLTKPLHIPARSAW
jgi:CRP-like cAMP-binding protein